MLCPMCKVELLIADRQGIEIDYCPTCRGIWLDRGELDKLLERLAMPAAQRGEYREAPVHHAQPVYHEEHHKPREQHRHKRRSFLEDIFDFD